MDWAKISGFVAAAGFMVSFLAGWAARAFREGKAVAKAEEFERRLSAVEKLSTENDKAIDHTIKNVAVLFERTNVVITAPKR